MQLRRMISRFVTSLRMRNARLHLHVRTHRQPHRLGTVYSGEPHPGSVSTRICKTRKKACCRRSFKNKGQIKLTSYWSYVLGVFDGLSSKLSGRPPVSPPPPPLTHRRRKSVQTSKRENVYHGCRRFSRGPKSTQATKTRGRKSRSTKNTPFNNHADTLSR